jgi:hypothetical protein
MRQLSMLRAVPDAVDQLRAARRRGIAPFVAMLLVVAFVQLWAMRFGWRWLRDDGSPSVSRKETGLRMAGEMSPPPGGFAVMGAPIAVPAPAEERGEVGKPSPITSGRVRRR